MKKLVAIINKVTPHLFIMFAIIFIVLLILDSYNPLMNFIDNNFSTTLLWIFCMAALIQGVTSLFTKK